MAPLGVFLLLLGTLLRQVHCQANGVTAPPAPSVYGVSAQLGTYLDVFRDFMMPAPKTVLLASRTIQDVFGTPRTMSNVQANQTTWLDPASLTITSQPVRDDAQADAVQIPTDVPGRVFYTAAAIPPPCPTCANAHPSATFEFQVTSYVAYTYTNRFTLEIVTDYDNPVQILREVLVVIFPSSGERVGITSKDDFSSSLWTIIGSHLPCDSRTCAGACAVAVSFVLCVLLWSQRRQYQYHDSHQLEYCSPLL